MTMNIVIAGGTGFIGQPLVERLLQNHRVTVLSRNPSKVVVGEGMAWSPGKPGDWQKTVAEADAVINLAGENIGAERWSEDRKRELLTSRLDATRALVAVVKEHPSSGRVVINASAIGWYGSREDEVLTEESGPGEDFLARLTRDWEAAAVEAAGSSRLVILRFGIVLAADGGALQKMLTPFRLFAGGPMGNGKQWMSWVDRDDIIGMIQWSLENSSARGTYNVTSPNPVRNKEFASILGAVLHRPSLIPTPRLALRIALGEMADPLLFSSQRVLPVRAEKEGFVFGYPLLRQALTHVLS